MPLNKQTVLNYSTRLCLLILLLSGQKMIEHTTIDLEDEEGKARVLGDRTTPAFDPNRKVYITLPKKNKTIKTKIKIIIIKINKKMTY